MDGVGQGIIILQGPSVEGSGEARRDRGMEGERSRTQQAMDLNS